MQIAPDKEAERQFLPAAATLTDRLLLADRGYPGVDYFEAVDEAGGAFIVRRMYRNGRVSGLLHLDASLGNAVRGAAPAKRMGRGRARD